MNPFKIGIIFDLIDKIPSFIIELETLLEKIFVIVGLKSFISPDNLGPSLIFTLPNSDISKAHLKTSFCIPSILRAKVPETSAFIF